MWIAPPSYDAHGAYRAAPWASGDLRASRRNIRLQSIRSAETQAVDTDLEQSCPVWFDAGLNRWVTNVELPSKKARRRKAPSNFKTAEETDDAERKEAEGLQQKEPDARQLTTKFGRLTLGGDKFKLRSLVKHIRSTALVSSMKNRRQRAANTMIAAGRGHLGRKEADRQRKEQEYLGQIGSDMYHKLEFATQKPDLQRKPSVYSMNRVIKTADGKRVLCRMSAYDHEGHFRVSLQTYSDKTEICRDILEGDHSGVPQSYESQKRVARQLVKAMDGGIPDIPHAEYMHFVNHFDLGNTLTRSHIDLSKWDKGVSKSVHDLLDEINLGLSHLEVYRDKYTDHEKLVRILHAVNVHVFSQDGSYKLVETHRTLPNGNTKIRKENNNVLSNKMNVQQQRMSRTKGVVKCAEQAIERDLGIPPLQIFVLDEESIVTKSHVRFSVAYPGLETKYYIHEVDAHVQHEAIKEALTKCYIATNAIDAAQSTVMHAMHEVKSFSSDEANLTRNTGDPTATTKHHWEWARVDESAGKNRLHARRLSYI
jgi:hypothetical protein